MTRNRRFFGWKTVLGLTGLAVVALALMGFRGPWRHGDDPARFTERLDWMQEEIAEELELQPHQQPAFDALMSEARSLAEQMRALRLDARGTVESALEQEPFDARAVGEAFKQHLRRLPDPTTLDRVIDRAVALYDVLEPEQQAEVLEHLEHRRRWHRH